MTFLAPERLWLLIVVVTLAATYVVLQLRRRHYAVRFTNLTLLDAVAPQRPGWRRHVVAAGSLLALAALMVGLARPARDERVPREEAVVMLVVDVSASMSAQDVAPTRLAAAITAAHDFVDEVPEKFQVGLVVFDGSARVLASPTTDHAVVAAAIDRVSLGEGTAAGEGLYAALDAIAGTMAATDADTATAGDAPSATIVLLSDGATTAGRPVDEAARAAADAGVPVSTIAFGTATGTVQVQGEIVAVPTDTASMQEVASITGGTFFEAASGEQLASVYDDIQGRVGSEVEQHELVGAFLGLGIALLSVATAASLLWTSRFL